MKEGRDEERRARWGWTVLGSRKRCSWEATNSPLYSMHKQVQDPNYTCWTEKQEKINPFMTGTKKENLPGTVLVLTVFKQCKKAQVASDMIYITLHNFMITIWQESSRPHLFHLFVAKKEEKKKNILDKQFFSPIPKNPKKGVLQLFSVMCVYHLESECSNLKPCWCNGISEQIFTDPRLLPKPWCQNGKDSLLAGKLHRAAWPGNRCISHKCKTKIIPATLQGWLEERIKCIARYHRRHTIKTFPGGQTLFVKSRSGTWVR